jgi:superfamily II DNA/RNA helicase
VDAVSSHGGKAQEEREAAMKDFKFGRADVLIATDVAAKVSFVFRHLMNARARLKSRQIV